MQSKAWTARAVLAGVFGSLAMAAPIPAQAPYGEPTDQFSSAEPAAPAVSLAALEQGVWTDVDSRGIHAHGKDYKSVFGLHGLVFTPALGKAAPFNQDFALRSLDVSRGGSAWEFGAAQPDLGEGVVTIARGRVLERFQLLPEGIEHSYVLQALPVGNGDLVIRHRVETPLAATSGGGESGVRFLLDGVGGVDVGGVTGIDANGVHFGGEVRFHDGVLEYRLPAGAVSAAVLPLTVDPFLATFNLQSVTNDEQNVDLVFDDTHNVWGICWQRNFSGSDSEIRGGIVNAGGSSLTTFVAITNDTVSQVTPRIANIDVNDSFVVAWTEIVSTSPVFDFDVKARAFSAATGALGAPPVTVAGGAGLQSLGDIAGDPTTVDNDAIAVFTDSATDGEVFVRQISVSPIQGLIPFSARVNLSNGGTTFNDSSPAITTNGGEANRYMVVWSRSGFAGTSNSAIRGAVVNRNLTVLDSFIAITGTGRDYDDPDVDGDGTLFVVAYERSEGTTTSGPDDIGVTSLIWDSSSSAAETLVSDVVLGSTTNDDENDPSVGYFGGEVVVVFEDVNAGTTTDYDIRYFAVDPYTCLSCETTNASVAIGSNKARFPRIGTRFASGDNTSDQGLVIWVQEAAGVTTNGDLVSRGFDPADGFLFGQGGGCGDAGELRVGCARSPNANAEIFLVGANPAATAWLVISQEIRNIPCGACVLRPDPFTGIIAASTVAANGTTSFPIAVPSSLVGRRVFAQWIVTDASPACGAFGSNLTDTTRITLD